MQLQRQQRTLKFDLGEQELTVTLETAGRLGAWKRDDYRDAIENHLFPGKQLADDGPRTTPLRTADDGEEDDGRTTIPTWMGMSRTQRYRYMLHLHEGSAIAGSLVSLRQGEEETDTLTPELYESLPDAVAVELLTVAYSLNPHWMPTWEKEDDQGEDPKGATRSG